MSDDLLDCLLNVAEEDITPTPKPITAQNEDSVFLSSITEYEQNPTTPKSKKNLSLIDKTKETVPNNYIDPLDHEDNDFNKYNTFGKSIHSMLDNTSSPKSYNGLSKTWKSKVDVQPSHSKQLGLPNKKPDPPTDVFTDPLFGIRISKPLVSHGMLKERMQGRDAIPMSKIRKYVEMLTPQKDWVIAGVIVHKTGKTSQKGNAFSIWTLSDLHGDLKTVSLFLFGSAYKELWKCVVGTVVGVLNPAVFEKKEGSKDEACLSVDNYQRVMIFGQSKDLGTCKSKKKNGEPCTAFVNVNSCEFCIYHIKQEYQKCSGRSELQSNFSGRGLTALRNKVLGKNEVFYAGKSYSAIPAGRNKKLVAKDQGRLGLLSGRTAPVNTAANVKTTPKRKQAVRLELSASQRAKDIELIKRLGGGSTDLNSAGNSTSSDKGGAGFAKLSAEVTLAESKNTALNVIAKLKAKQAELKTQESPTSKSGGGFSKLSAEVTLEESRNTALSVIAKLKAKKNQETDQSDISDNSKGLNTSLNSSNGSSSEKKTQFSKSPRATSSTLNEISTNSLEMPRSQNSVSLFPKVNTNTVPKLSNFEGFDIPVLSGFGKKTVDLSAPISRKHVEKAKLNAVKWVQRYGPIKKADPNKKDFDKSKKRVLDVLDKEESDPKKRKIQENEYFSDRFKKMMAATSKHMDLLDQHDNDEQEKYFNKLEVKERMEEKMLNTYKIECKAVRCLKCKYTSFSASDLCKSEKHPLKVFDGVKRFFKCGDCGNRTVSLDIVPTHPCKNCGSGKWERTTMIKEKKVTSTHTLSIRGGEQKFTNSLATDSNINLLVPE